MEPLQEVPIGQAALERFVPLVGEERVEHAVEMARALRERAAERTIWNVNSTAVGGGVAEMLRSLLAYARGAGVDVRWLVIRGDPEFFRITKRLHNALHGELGDGSPLGPAERERYQATLHGNLEPLLGRVRRGDVVILHDPQPAGLAPALLEAGAHVVWRCHIGTDLRNAQTMLGWSFLLPYLREVQELVFSRTAFVPRELQGRAPTIITPSIDPFAAKNAELGAEQVREILSCTGLVEGHCRAARFPRDDGTTAPIEHAADVLQLGPPVRAEVPLVVQVSRWDELKDPVGVLLGFARALPGLPPDAELMLAGPTVRSVADDPDGPRVFGAVTSAWQDLPHPVRRRVHLANLPMRDVEENGAIVNALQRHAAVVVQKSLREGFGLTVTEAMWKARPVIASAVGGILDQIEDGVSGLLLRDPRDLDGFGAALQRVLNDRALAARLGTAARERVRERFLGVRHLLQYAEIIERLDATAGPPPPQRPSGAGAPAPSAKR